MTDKQYEAARNKLIPEAKEHADKIAGPRPRKGVNKNDGQKRCNTWNLAFHTKMNTLARENGLIN